MRVEIQRMHLRKPTGEQLVKHVLFFREAVQESKNEKEESFCHRMTCNCFFFITWGPKKSIHLKAQSNLHEIHQHLQIDFYCQLYTTRRQFLKKTMEHGSLILMLCLLKLLLSVRLYVYIHRKYLIISHHMSYSQNLPQW